MKTLIKLFLLSLWAGVVACGTVSSSSDPTPAGTTKSELIAGKTSKSWELTTIKIEGVDKSTTSKSCSKDDILLFTNPNNYERNEGQTKCKANDPQVYEKGTWSISTDQTTLIYSGSTTKYTILELGSSVLRTSYKNKAGEVVEEIYKMQSSN